MLHYNCVYKETLSLLKALMQTEILKNYRLVGGTAIALFCGHRISYDLDLFTDIVIDKDAVLNMLKEKFSSNPDKVYDYFISGIVKHQKRNVKVDLLKYYPPL